MNDQGFTAYDEDVLRRARAAETSRTAISTEDLRDLLRLIQELEEDLALAGERETAAYDEGGAEADREAREELQPRIEALEEQVADLKSELEEANAQLEVFS